MNEKENSSVSTQRTKKINSISAEHQELDGRLKTLSQNIFQLTKNIEEANKKESEKSIKKELKRAINQLNSLEEKANNLLEFSLQKQPIGTRRLISHLFESNNEKNLSQAKDIRSIIEKIKETKEKYNLEYDKFPGTTLFEEKEGLSEEETEAKKLYKTDLTIEKIKSQIDEIKNIEISTRGKRIIIIEKMQDFNKRLNTLTKNFYTKPLSKNPRVDRLIKEKLIAKIEKISSEKLELCIQSLKEGIEIDRLSNQITDTLEKEYMIAALSDPHCKDKGIMFYILEQLSSQSEPLLASTIKTFKEKLKRNQQGYEEEKQVSDEEIKIIASYVSKKLLIECIQKSPALDEDDKKELIKPTISQEKLEDRMRSITSVIKNNLVNIIQHSFLPQDTKKTLMKEINSIPSTQKTTEEKDSTHHHTRK